MRCDRCGGRVQPAGSSGVQLRNNTSAKAAVRPLEAPAPTLYFGARLNTMWWERADV